MYLICGAQIESWKMERSLEARNKVWDLIKDIRVAMFVTQAADGKLSARPMSAVNKEFSGALWFMTAGDSPKLDEVRASLALEFLEHTSLPVAEIAARTGFSEVASFRKAFRKWTGNAPSHYRERAGDPPSLPSPVRSP